SASAHTLSYCPTRRSSDLDLRPRPGGTESVPERTALLPAGAGTMSGVDGATPGAPAAAGVNPLGPQGAETSVALLEARLGWGRQDRKSTRLNSSHVKISYA